MADQACPLHPACVALWSATLSLMTAYMQHTAPAHRLLLARRIAANFATLAQQGSFAPAARASFARLHLRWDGIAAGLAQPAHSTGGQGLLERLLPAALRNL